MRRIGWLISRYLLSTILPYFLFAWVLLSAILFVQQAGKFSDIFFDLNVPAGFVWQLAVALIPNVISFTCPMAALVATIIGISKMRTDSELVAIRAAGIGSLQLAVPIVVFGLALSAFAFFVNLKGVPFAASLVRSVVLQAAIKKLESPIEPGTFNSEVNGYTIYVAEGDREAGEWKNVYVFRETADKGVASIITSARGRLDFTDEATELVLSDAKVVTLPATPAERLVSESIGDIRLATNTRRNELIDRLAKSERVPEELGLQELSQVTATLEGKERIEAELLFQRRLSLSLAPLIFSILGFSIAIRFSRGGRGTGIMLALATLVGYYLISFGAEQLARTGRFPAALTGLVPTIGALAMSVWFWLTSRFTPIGADLFNFAGLFNRLGRDGKKGQTRNRFIGLTTGIRDLDIVIQLSRFFALSVVFVSALFIVFTAFDLWKFAGNSADGVGLLVKYLFFLLPYIFLQIAPTAVLIAVVATLVTKSRQHEFVTWAAAGQSAYRALVPCLLFALAVGIVSFAVQEGIAPSTNKLQDSLRAQIRSGGSATAGKGRAWAAGNGRIYSFKVGAGAAVRPSRTLGSASDNDTQYRPDLAEQANHSSRQFAASDNETSYAVPQIEGRGEASGAVPDRGLDAGDQGDGVNQNFVAVAGPGTAQALIASSTLLAQNANASASDNETQAAPCSLCPTDLLIYEFDTTGLRLQTVYRSEFARFEKGKVRLAGKTEMFTVANGETAMSGDFEFAESADPFEEAIGKPSHLTLTELRRQINATDAESEKNMLGVSLQKRLTILLLPLVIALFAAPLTLSLSGKGNISHIAFAVAGWLLLIGSISVFSQFGESGQLDPIAAAWAPLIIMTLIGGYLISRMRT
ncbi:MAG: LptF/LptG family permease [Blastocatellia bacterium]|nr:LptF/LptG family permease [Blastocatellia bacterium]